jgi:hypothetical protein
MKAHRWFVAAVAVLLCGFGAAWAQTPDDQTPSEESVCDVLLEPGITPGLYGLCVAFCEAQDLEMSEREALCNSSGDKLLRNYIKKMGPNDPKMPCLRPDCSCFSYEDVALLTLEKPGTGCWLYTCVDDESYDRDGNLMTVRTMITYKKYRANVWADYRYPEKTYCQWYFHGENLVVNISLEEAEVCREILLNSGDPACFD